MALRQIMLAKKIEQRKASLATLVANEEGLNTRSAELEASVEEAETDEEMAAVEEEVEKLEGEKKDHEEKKSKLEGEIADLEGELEQLNNKQPSNTERGKKDMGKENRGVQHQYLTREVEDFYSELRSRLKTRANGQVLPAGEAGAELVIPDIIVNRIRERIGDYTTLYPLVDKITAGGRVKLILDVDAGEATWLEQRGALPESDDSELTAVQFDGFKVGRIVYIDNSLLEDNIINLDDYLTKRIARSIAKAIDKAILNGTGAAGKQPEGIIPAIPEENQVEAEANYAELIPHIGLIDTGEDASGEIVVTIHRQTYYSKLATLSLHVNSEGQDVVMLPNLSQPNFLGLRVVFNNYMPKDKLLFAVYDKYTLVEREGTRVDMSGHYKFREDQTAIRGVGRYDGKPVKPEAFVLVTLVDSTTEA
ncbi:phage major capsid protein [Neobacillus sp. MM2021_6]|uniref:phage major capsid protein n=1 Tax=Bacillaceae TaxID=186817 RepID=UPI001408E990|nr:MULTISPECIES: phage major capsid protein [Bacillaceae]MBO0962500.1 phage major capsid protein [Neobacillus sp. MM2021_6]NHC21289.1 phage major capsid protein [Bacillus sp. MM2020_4]